jgi:hypothetical protein
MKVSAKVRAYAAVAYADIFDFPLTAPEVELWMVGSGEQEGKKRSLIKTVDGAQTFYTLKNRQHIIRIRKKRKAAAHDKWQRAHTVAGWLSYIPTIELVGVTGGLAMENAKEDDDIDLFFIASVGTVWVTRFIVTLLVHMRGVRRTPDAQNVKNAICLNMFMAKDALTLPQSEQDFFAAHEVLQMKPLWHRRGAYTQFLKANAWTKRFLPHAYRAIYAQRKNAARAEGANTIIALCMFVSRILEPIARATQLWYMHTRRTVEKVERGVLRFHPRDARVWIKKRYMLRLTHKEVEKIFSTR